ncbi:MAG: A/G-specific adenine glycosylase, partial [Chitinophagaceae bacterium]
LGFVHQLPVKEKKLIKKHRWFNYFLMHSPDAVYIRKRTANDIWQNLHEFVLHESTDAEPFAHHAWLKQVTGGQPFTIVGQSAVYKQQLTHQTIHGKFYEVEVSHDFNLSGDYFKVQKNAVGEYAFPRMINHFLTDASL